MPTDNRVHINKVWEVGTELSMNLEASVLSDIYKISWLVGVFRIPSNEKQVMMRLEEMISKGERVNINSSFEMSVNVEGELWK